MLLPDVHITTAGNKCSLIQAVLNPDRILIATPAKCKCDNKWV